MFTQVDSWTGKIAVVVAPTQVGVAKGRIVSVEGWYTGISTWLPIPVTGTLLGAEFMASINVQNTGVVRARVHVEATLVKPSLQRVPLAMGEGQDAVLEAGGGRNVQSVRFPLAETGSYSLEVSLSMELA